MRHLPLVTLCFVAGMLGGMTGSGLIMHNLHEPSISGRLNESCFGTPRPGTPSAISFVQNTRPIPPGLTPTKSNNPVIDAVKRVGPAVVNIDTVVMRRQSVFGMDFFADDPFTSLVPSKGQGSGVIIDGVKGYILTNEHVVHNVVAVGKGEIKVSLPNKETYDATVVGADPQYDIAVIKIDGKNLPSVKLASSNDLVIGEWAVAVGNPFGYRNTVTLGVISALDRSLDNGDGGRLEGLIQTDAAINPGNSGGPLCDIDGNVIGINTAIINGASGLGFAIGASTIKPVVDEIIKFGRVKHGWTGMKFWDISRRLANRLGLDSTDGALVSEIYNGSPADKAGIKPGDIIIEANAKKILTVADIQDALRESRAGDNVSLSLQRKGKKVQIKLQLADLPEGG